MLKIISHQSQYIAFPSLLSCIVLCLTFFFFQERVSHTPGRHFMMNYHDGLAICRVHGAPDLVSTFACNAKWPEITEPLLLEPCQQPYNRDDLIVRLYGLKLSEYIDDTSRPWRGGTPRPWLFRFNK